LTHAAGTSGQRTLYGGKPIPSTERDDTYILDGILDNGTTELNSSLFDLVGLQFSPLIRDMADQRLFRLGRSTHYQHIEPLFSGMLNRDLIFGQRARDDRPRYE
jgi:hypothetical protein